MLVVARDVVVKLLPQPLDDVIVGRIGRQEVEHDARSECFELPDNAVRFVNTVIVEHEMDPPRSPVSAAEEVQKLREYLGVLSFGYTVDDSPGTGIERSKDVALDVLSRCQHNRLLPALQVRRPEFGFR